MISPVSLKSFAAALTAASVLAFGPATAEPTSIEAEALAGLSQIETKKFNELYVNTSADFSGYSKILIEPATVAIREDAQRKYSDRDNAYMAERLTSRLEKRFEKRFELATAPGDKVLRVAATLVDFEANKEFQAPYGPGEEPRGAVRGLNYDSVGIGSAAVEAVLTDSISGELLAVMVYKRQGASLGTNFNVNTRWGDALDAFRRFAVNLSDFVDSQQTVATN